jgi:hypothetical protein
MTPPVDLARRLLADKIASRLKKDPKQLFQFVLNHLLMWPDDYVAKELEIEGIKLPKEKA